MAKKMLPIITATLDKIIGGGQAIGTLEDGRKILVWGGLPGETVEIQVTKKKSHYLEGYVTDILSPSSERITPRDPESYLSTSPWQIMDFSAEQHYKAALVEEAFELHDIVLPDPIDIFSDNIQFEYRNKIEFSFWFDTAKNQLDLAFHRRGTHGKIAINTTALASPAITTVSQQILAKLRDQHIEGRSLKTLLIRSNRVGETAWQLYVKDEDFPSEQLISTLRSTGTYGEIIYSNPKSPASVITKRLAATSQQAFALSDTILGTPFTYATEGFFQINLPVYEQALRDMATWVPNGQSAVDLYSGVGTIGLTIGGDEVTLVELNEHAVREMRQNIASLGINATAVLAASEEALDYISNDKTIIVDPPRAGLHEDVIKALLEKSPNRIIYLSCNPVTQARDIARLASGYGIRSHRGYNFFPRTPHIEHLVVLDRLSVVA